MTADDFRSNPDRHCAGVHPNIMFPDGTNGTDKAIAICQPYDKAACPVLEQCLQYALNNHEKFGVWGGKSQRARERILKGRIPRNSTPRPGRPGKPPYPIDHGTESGAAAHRRRGIPECDACRDARNAAANRRDRDRYRRQKAAIR